MLTYVESSCALPSLLAQTGDSQFCCLSWEARQSMICDLPELETCTCIRMWKVRVPFGLCFFSWGTRGFRRQHLSTEKYLEESHLHNQCLCACSVITDFDLDFYQ